MDRLFNRQILTMSLQGAQCWCARAVLWFPHTLLNSCAGNSLTPIAAGLREKTFKRWSGYGGLSPHEQTDALTMGTGKSPQGRITTVRVGSPLFL